MIINYSPEIKAQACDFARASIMTTFNDPERFDRSSTSELIADLVGELGLALIHGGDGSEEIDDGDLRTLHSSLYDCERLLAEIMIRDHESQGQDFLLDRVGRMPALVPDCLTSCHLDRALAETAARISRMAGLRVIWDDHCLEGVFNLAGVYSLFELGVVQASLLESYCQPWPEEWRESR